MPDSIAPDPDGPDAVGVEPPTQRVLAGRYRLGARIGSGGMADVYRAMDLRLDRSVAVKLFRDGVDPAMRRRLTEEATLLARLTYPGLVAVYDIGTASGTAEAGNPYLVMQLIDGMTLRERLFTEPMTETEMVRLGGHLAEAIGYVHAQGIVHRDIKPSNVLLDVAGRPWLADFGISLLLGSTRLTRTGQLIGTAGYLAPEQVLGQQVGPAADVYALGLVLLECLSGFPEYDGGDIEVAVARLHRPPRIPPTLSAPIADLLSAMTAAEPERRPDAASCAAALRGAGSPDAPTTVLPGPVPMGSPAGPMPPGGPATRQFAAVAAAGPSTRQFDGPLVPPGSVPEAAAAAATPAWLRRPYAAAGALLLVAVAIVWALSSGGDPQPVQQAVPPPPETSLPVVTTTPAAPSSEPAETSEPPTAVPTTTTPPRPAKHKKKDDSNGDQQG